MGSLTCASKLVHQGTLLAFWSTILQGVGADLRPKYARVNSDIETVWQRPHAELPRGVFFIAHGCQHQGTDIFSDVGHDGWRFAECEQSNFGKCLGLPEEIRLRDAARSRGYVVMAVSGGRGLKSCWNMERDLARVDAAIRHVKAAEGLREDAPVLAYGASSGGAFVGRLTAPVAKGGVPHLHCIVPEIMAVHGAPNRGVPVLFVHMPRDQRTAAAVNTDISALRKQGVRVSELQVNPRPVTAEFLAPCLNEELASEAMEALHADGLLDGAGHLKRDARERQWVPILAAVLSGRGVQDTLMPDESCLAELMNVAWAKHEFSAQFAEQILDFCEKKHVVDLGADL